MRTTYSWAPSFPACRGSGMARDGRSLSSPTVIDFSFLSNENFSAHLAKCSLVVYSLDYVSFGRRLPTSKGSNAFSPRLCPSLPALSHSLVVAASTPWNYLPPFLRPVSSPAHSMHPAEAAVVVCRRLLRRPFLQLQQYKNC